MRLSTVFVLCRDKNNVNFSKTPVFTRFLTNARLLYKKYNRTRLCQKSSKISVSWLYPHYSCLGSRDKNSAILTGVDFCFLWEYSLVVQKVQLHSPLLKIIENLGILVLFALFSIGAGQYLFCMDLPSQYLCQNLLIMLQCFRLRFYGNH